MKIKVELLSTIIVSGKAIGPPEHTTALICETRAKRLEARGRVKIIVANQRDNAPLNRALTGGRAVVAPPPSNAD